jgi:hypothetical protein
LHSKVRFTGNIIGLMLQNFIVQGIAGGRFPPFFMTRSGVQNDATVLLCSLIAALM